MILRILALIYVVFMLFFNIFVIIKAFLRGYSDWGWGLIIINIAGFGIMSFSNKIEVDFLNILFMIVVFAILNVPSIYVYRIAKLPDMPSLPCKGCGEEVNTKRKVTVNLDNNEIVTPRSTSLVLLITGGGVTVLGIWLFIFALQYDQSVSGPVISIMFGFSLVGMNLRALINKPKKLGLGYLYKCKKCEKKWVHVPENSQQ